MFLKMQSKLWLKYYSTTLAKCKLLRPYFLKIFHTLTLDFEELFTRHHVIVVFCLLMILSFMRKIMSRNKTLFSLFFLNEILKSNKFIIHQYLWTLRNWYNYLNSKIQFLVLHMLLKFKHFKTSKSFPWSNY